jgi:hypothetical protein
MPKGNTKIHNYLISRAFNKIVQASGGFLG